MTTALPTGTLLQRHRAVNDSTERAYLNVRQDVCESVEAKRAAVVRLAQGLGAGASSADKAVTS